MNVEAFLKALPTVASSPLAFIGYLALLAVWTLTYWRTARLRLILKRIEKIDAVKLPEILRDEYGIRPKGGLDARSYLIYQRRTTLLVAYAITLATALVILAIVTYRAVEEGRHSVLQQSMKFALDATKIGRVQAAQNSFKEAVGRLDTALRVHPSYQGWMNLGYVYESISDTDHAIRAYEEAQKFEPDNPEPLNALGFIYKDKGKLDTAFALLKKANDLLAQRGVGNNELRFSVNGNLGNIYYERARQATVKEERRQLARTALDDYFVPAEKFNADAMDQDLVAKVLANMGNTYVLLEEYGAAREKLDMALAIKKRIFASRSLADTLNNWGDFLVSQCQYEQAKPHFLEAHELFDRAGNDLGKGVTLINLGDIAWRAGIIEKARANYHSAKDLFVRGGVGGEYLRGTEQRIEAAAKGGTFPFSECKSSFLEEGSWTPHGVAFAERRTRIQRLEYLG